jgi:hypothetical protein
MSTDKTIQLLKAERKSLQSCLDDKDWACDNDEYHKSVRTEYTERVRELDSDIEQLQSPPSDAVEFAEWLGNHNYLFVHITKEYEEYDSVSFKPTKGAKSKTAKELHRDFLKWKEEQK